MQKKKLILIVVLVIASFLRIWKLDKVPVSLFGDEVDIGYHAYSILKTGKDYYGNSWPIHFHSIAEWRTPLYLYSSVPTVALFGISPLGVRLPAAIFGILGVWGMYLLANELLTYQVMEKNNKRSQIIDHQSLALIAAFILAISPWHLQYSRAAFEVSMLLAFLIFGIYFFFKAIGQNGKWMWLSATFLAFTPWIYSTAKLFTPLLMIFLLIIWRKEVFSVSRKDIVKGVIVVFVVGAPIAYSTIFGGGAQRAGYTSVFTDPTIEPEVGFARTIDFLQRGETDIGYKYSFSDRFFHNKFTFWFNNITRNYLQAFSSDFLFEQGDPNLRHSIKGIGQFFKIEFLALSAGLILFFTSKVRKEIKALIAFWLLVGGLPASLTRDGGNHATRLILILPPLILLNSYGIFETLTRIKGHFKLLLSTSYSFLLALSFIFYLHKYYIHNPWDSERWWHAGFKEAIQSIKEVDNNYDRVIISMASEPAWIFFAGWYQYPPDLWQKDFPIGNDEYVNGFGNVSHTGKFYFGNFNVPGKSIYDLGKYIDNKTLYLATAKEIGANLIMEPERTPPDLKLVKSIAYPSSEPAFYLFTLQ